MILRIERCPVFMLLIASTISSWSPVEGAPVLQGIDGISGRVRTIGKNDVVAVGTKQCVKKGDVCQRNALERTILPKGSSLAAGQCSSFEDCVGKIAKRELGCGQTLDQSCFANPKTKAKKSKVTKALVRIDAGEFVDPKWVRVVEKPIPPNKTPMEWLSNLRDVVGRKTAKQINAGELVTESHFGPRGNLLHPEEIKDFGTPYR